MCAHQKGSWSQAFLAETVETGNKNRDLTDDISECHTCFVKKDSETLMRKMSSFFGTGRPTNLSLERVDYFAISEYFSGRKNEKSL